MTSDETGTIPSPMAIMDRGEDRTDNLTVVVQPLTPEYFDDARQIYNEFLSSSHKGCCGGLCPFALCPASRSEFEAIFRKSPDRCSTYGLAMMVPNHTNDNNKKVVGVINLRQGGQPTKWDENLIHRPKAQEMYVDYMAVTKASRGMGAGTKLLEWAEAKARERGATVLSLGVVNGNPAKRLYDRNGFQDKSSNCFTVWCLIGMPHGRLGGVDMEKELS